ncbi:uncharacterized protein LOC127565004 [Drosophila albomicans]|uniref:Uncharacterized protein LOC127565004 n=1 Tax=Drosophila albomicans TaxID=7291 RepID=A0A9C6WCV8_DROAB|nr:uncharacterized protein LOC127565004 [Drosophila albomicans]
MHWLYRFFFICLLDLGVLAHVRLAELNYGSTPDYELNYRSTPDYERYCPPEDFEHSYLSNGENNSLIKETHVNHFRRTKIGKRATMRDLCLDSSGLPVQRQCEDYYGSAIWKPLDNISCNAGNNLSWGLNQLHEELLRGDDEQIILTRLQHSLSEAHGQLTPVDVYITAQICNSFVEKERYNEALGTNLISICSEIMNINETVLELSAKVNATNVLLVHFDKYMDAISEQFVSEERCGNVFMNASRESSGAYVELHNYSDIGVQALISRNLSVFYVNPSCSNITGLAIYSVAGPDRISTSKDFWFRFVYANESIENLKLESDLETAVYITDSEYVSRLLSNDLPYVVFKIYENDALFLDDSEEHKKRFRSKVLSGKLLGDLDTQRNYSMQLLLRKPKELDVQCRRWHNHHWRYYGVYDSIDSTISEDYVLCVGYEWPMGTNVRIQWKSIKNNIEYCAAEDFEHTYKIKSENGSLSTELHINHFRRTNLNILATMKDLCLDSSGLPVQRLCKNNNGTAIWEPLDNISCNAGNNLSWGLNQLYDNIFRGDDVQVILTRLQHSLIEARGQLTPIDVYITAQIFTTFVEQKIYYKALGLNWISICSEIMNSNETVLEVSAKVNATNVLLDSFDKYMDAISEQFLSVERCGNVFINLLRESNGANVQLHNYSDIGVQALISRNLSVFYVNPSCYNITGLAIYSAAGLDRISTSKDFWFRFVYANESIENIMLESDLETAVYMTDKFMSQLVGIDLPYVVLKIYENDALFMEYSLERKRRVRSRVISGKLLGDHGTQRPYGMQLLLRKPKELAGACRQWDNDHWQYEGVTTSNDTNISKDYVLCIGYEWPMGTNVQLQWESHEKNTKENSSEYCAAEDFEHTYKIKSENGSLSIKTHINHFKRTNLNILATMEDLCLDSRGLPVHRLCENKNGIATWGPLQNIYSVENKAKRSFYLKSANQ